MMSTKRKAEGHSRSAGKLRTAKSSGRSGTDSERDSGFSDVGSVSAMDIADLEDSPRAVVGSSSGAQPSQLAVVGGSYSNLSPVIIMNNVLLKQPGETPPALKPWAFSPTVEVVQQPQVVFLQPVVSRSKEATSKHRRPKKYLPILKSYPKIAPHPGGGHGSSGRSSTSSTTSSSGYSSSSSSSGKSGTSSHRERSHHRDKHQQRSSSVRSSSSSSTASLPPASGAVPPLLLQRLTDSSSSSSPASERPSPAVSRSGLSPSQCLTPSYCLEDPEEAPSPPDLAPCVSATAEQQHGSDSSECTDDEPDAKRKRFCNTYNILSKSGLLDITLRTKELLRQNRRTQTELDRLKEHTALFLKALQSGDSSIFVGLQSSLQEEDREREKEKEKVVQPQTTD